MTLLGRALAVATLLASAASARTGDVFLVAPYLQLGESPSPKSLRLLWHTRDVDGGFSVESRTGGGRFKAGPAPTFVRVAVRSVEPHRVWSALLQGLRPGEPFDYRLLKDGAVVFEARSRAPKSRSQPYRFAVFGDSGQDNGPQKAVALRTWEAKPDFVVLAGDIVYTRGRVSEYFKHFRVYNAEEPSAEAGAPLLRSVLFIGAPGNHDIANTDLGTYPDGLAYFYYWKQPLNGPAFFKPAPLRGPDDDQQAFRAAAGDAYPRMANFSFDYGNSHWTILDSNPYVDWNDPALRQWLATDLASAKRARWRFVAFHHPGFHSSKTHFKEQQARVLAGVLEEGRVDLVFSGHVHNYPRTFPMRYRGADGGWTLDKTFDGARATRPNGVIYVVSGGGGASLYNPEQQDAPETWPAFTARFVSKIHSVTLVDVDGRRLSLRQVAADGQELDRVVIRKP